MSRQRLQRLLQHIGDDLHPNPALGAPVGHEKAVRPVPDGVEHLDMMADRIGVSFEHGAPQMADVMRGHCHGAPGLRRSRWPGSRTRMNKISYSGYRFPPEIIQQAIWLYLRFTLSLRDVEDLLAERGVAVSYETVRRWVNHFGPMIAAHLRKRRLKPHTTWHL